MFVGVQIYTAQKVFAETPTTAPTATIVPTSAPTTTPTITGTPTPTPLEGNWIKDSEVTFVGKTAARSNSFLDWSLKNYNWLHLEKDQVNPLVSFWITIRNIMYAFLVLFVIVSAFVLMVSRGRNISVLQLIPRFLLIVILITFSFAFIQFFYQITDIIQGFFFKNATGDIISSKDLLNVGFDYQKFEGYRLSGDSYNESVFTSLLLIKLTAFTYYALGGVLLIRKVILWFFIIVSPLFPFLFLYNPIKNSARVWMSELFRWLLYGPLFSILLAGVVTMWTKGLPLDFDKFETVGKADKIIYPSAISILLGGPGQKVSLLNSLNLPETFALYIISLIMLWVVIVLPFLLLHIFLQYVSSETFANNSFVSQIVSKSPFLTKNFPFLRPKPHQNDLEPPTSV